MRWDDKSRERPVDFRSAPNQPYFVDKHILRPEPAGPLLQVPVTIARKKLSAIEYLKYVKRNKRIPYKGSQPYWLRPVFSSTDDYRNIIQDVDEMNNYKQFTVYNMMFHNVEVMPGLSPYTLTAADCRKYLESLEWLFTYCNDHDIQSVALSTLYDVFKEQ